MIEVTVFKENSFFKLIFEKFNFPAGEVHVRLKDMPEKIERVYFTANNTSSDDIMSLLLLTNAFRSIQPNIKIDLCIPYCPYSRQDRVINRGEPNSLKMFSEIINSQNYNTVTTWDVHSPVACSLINNLFVVQQYHWVGRVLSKYYHSQKPSNIFLVSPDMGATNKTTECSKILKIKNIIQAHKSRNSETGKIEKTIIIDEKDFYEGHLLVVDDICDGGRTFIELGKLLEPKCYSLSLYVTHGIFSQGIEELLKYYTVIFTANKFDNDLSNVRLFTV